MSWYTTIIERIVRALGGTMPPSTAGSATASGRETAYRYRELFYANALYLTKAKGGQLEDLLRNELYRTDCDTTALMLGLVGSVKEIVDLYAAIFPGTWGDGMGIKPTVAGRPVNEALVKDDPLGRLWRWSGLDTEKQKLLEWGPNLGTVGIRVYGRNDSDPLLRRVYLQLDHPGRIEDFLEDDRGNVTDVMLKYKIRDPKAPVGDTTAGQVEVEETLTKTSFSRKYDGQEQLTGEAAKNTLGICPYVILRHLDRGNAWGDWAYVGSEPIIHAANYLAGLLFNVTDQNANANYFATGGGEAPATFDLFGKQLKYVKTVPDTPPPTFEAIIAAIDYEGVGSVLDRLLKNLRSRQPELNFNATDVVANTSGEALQAFMEPTKKKIIDARPNYDHALKRAMQIGLSYMIGMDLVDLGTGMGSAQAADQAYQQGKMDFDFIDRPALPLTTFQQSELVKLETAKPLAKATLAMVQKNLGYDKSTYLQTSGLTKEEAKKMLQRAAQIDVTEDNEL